jgi:hypothetical protein
MLTAIDPAKVWRPAPSDTTFLNTLSNGKVETCCSSAGSIAPRRRPTSFALESPTEENVSFHSNHAAVHDRESNSAGSSTVWVALSCDQHAELRADVLTDAPVDGDVRLHGDHELAGDVLERRLAEHLDGALSFTSRAS